MRLTLLRLWLIAFISTCFAPAAIAQTKLQPGDLVEYVSGLGPGIGEVIEGPDAANYYVLRIPGKRAQPINGNKLRLVQRAGTPNAPLAVGEAVGWTSGGVAEKGTVVGVNGAWCEVKSLDATTLGWIECGALRTARQSKPAPAAAAAPAGSALPANLLGEWETSDGTFKLELQAAGKCYMSAGPMTDKCTYKTSATELIVRMADEDMRITANDDGSLSGPPDSMIPVRFKKKK